jgi:hypothetical protein
MSTTPEPHTGLQGEGGACPPGCITRRAFCGQRRFFQDHPVRIFFGLTTRDSAIYAFESVGRPRAKNGIGHIIRLTMKGSRL